MNFLVKFLVTICCIHVIWADVSHLETNENSRKYLPPSPPTAAAAAYKDASPPYQKSEQHADTTLDKKRAEKYRNDCEQVPECPLKQKMYKFEPDLDHNYDKHKQIEEHGDHQQNSQKNVPASNGYKYEPQLPPIEKLARNDLYNDGYKYAQPQIKFHSSEHKHEHYHDDQQRFEQHHNDAKVKTYETQHKNDQHNMKQEHYELAHDIQHDQQHARQHDAQHARQQDQQHAHQHDEQHARQHDQQHARPHDAQHDHQQHNIKQEHLGQRHEHEHDQPQQIAQNHAQHRSDYSQNERDHYDNYHKPTVEHKDNQQRANYPNAANQHDGSPKNELHHVNQQYSGRSGAPSHSPNHDQPNRSNYQNFEQNQQQQYNIDNKYQRNQPQRDTQGLADYNQHAHHAEFEQNRKSDAYYTERKVGLVPEGPAAHKHITQSVPSAEQPRSNQQHAHAKPKQRDGFRLSTPQGIPDPPLRSYVHATPNANARTQLSDELFTPADRVELNNERFVSYNNAPYSVFHTQVNLDSPGNTLNVANTFPNGGGGAAASSNDDAFILPSSGKSDAGALEVIYRPEHKQGQFTNEFREDGYHYDKPGVSFTY